MKLPCARSHSNASKLDAVSVKQYFTQCSVRLVMFLSPSIGANRRAEFEGQRHEKVNAWICARRTTHHDLVSVVPDEMSSREKEKTRDLQPSYFFADIMFLELIAAVTISRNFLFTNLFLNQLRN